MSIRLVCENEASYDPQSGTFTYCDHSFTCDESLLAKVTKCPKCQNPIRVGSSRRHVWADNGQPVADPNAVNQQAMKEHSGKEPAAKGVDDKQQGPGGKSSSTKAASSTQASSSGGTKRSRSKSPKSNACHSCGAPLNESYKKCPACFAPVSQPKGLSSTSLTLKQPIGFHRWVLRTVLAGVPPNILGWGSHLLALGMLIAVSLLAFAFFSRQAASIVTGFAVFFVFLYAYVFFTCYRTCTNLDVPLRWWQQIFWHQILGAGRRRGWVYDPALGRERIILDLRGKKVNDDLLVTMENITVCEVLDLQGCPITDKGTQGLHFLKDLRCLVLKGTLVSKLEIARLQKSLPQCWIWY